MALTPFDMEGVNRDLLDVCERENAADVLADLQAWWKTSQPDMRQHVDEMMAGIDAAMEPLDKRLYAAAEKEFKERSLDPDGECYQLDGGTFISQESFDGICGDQRDRYMAWKNQAEPARLVSAWDDPARLDRLVGDAIDADDGGGCFYTDAQPIDYTPWITAHSSWPQTAGWEIRSRWRVGPTLPTASRTTPISNSPPPGLPTAERRWRSRLPVPPVMR